MQYLGVNLDRLVHSLHCLFLLYFSCIKSKKKRSRPIIQSQLLSFPYAAICSKSIAEYSKADLVVAETDFVDGISFPDNATTTVSSVGSIAYYRWLVVILCAFLFRPFLTDVDTNTMNAGGAAMYIPWKDEWHCSPYCSVALIIDLFHCTEIPDMVVDCLCGTLGSISFSIAIAFCTYSADFVT